MLHAKIGPLLFLVFINDLDCEAESVVTIPVLKFADDTKVAQTIEAVRTGTSCLLFTAVWFFVLPVEALEEHLFPLYMSSSTSMSRSSFTPRRHGPGPLEIACRPS